MSHSPRTAQEIFDTVVNGLLRQGKPAYEKLEKGLFCRYRTSEGARCAMGWLIPDSFYRKNMEGWGAADLIIQYNFFRYLEPHIELIDQLQTLHDTWAARYHVNPNHETLSWLKLQLRQIADQYKFNYPSELAAI